MPLPTLYAPRAGGFAFNPVRLLPVTASEEKKNGRRRMEEDAADIVGFPRGGGGVFFGSPV
jgi:hypothetical protein